MDKRNCLHCKTTFEPRAHNQKFCQKQCRIDHNKGVPPPLTIEEARAEHIALKKQYEQEELSEQSPKIEDAKGELLIDDSKQESESENSEQKKTLEMLENLHLESEKDSEKTPIVNEEEKTLKMPEIPHLESDLSELDENSEKDSEKEELEGEADSDNNSEHNNEHNSEHNNELEHFDLGDYLGNNETPEKDESTTIETPPPSENEDFDREQVEAIEQEKETALKVVDDLENDALKVLMNPKEAATISITAFSVFQDFLLPFIYKKTAFTKPQESRLKSLARLSKQKKLDKLSDEDYELLDEWSAYEDYKELVPLSEKEKDLLHTPLEKLFQSSDGKGMSPFWALILVLITIMSSRMIPIANAFKNRNKFDVETKHLRANHRKEGLRKD